MPLRRRASGLAGFLLLVIVSATAAAQTISAAAVTAEIAVLLGAENPVIAGEGVDLRELRRIYAAFEHAPVWGPGSAAAENGRRVEARLRSVDEHAIDPAALHIDTLARNSDPRSPREAAERDLLLTDALLRYATRLRQGSVPVAALGEDWSIAPDPFAASEGLVAALRTDSLIAWLDALEPPYPQYRQLMAALRHYRGLARRGGWSQIAGSEELKLDGGDPRRSALRERLRAEGDLAPADTDTASLAEAVRRFQRRHGLVPDGRIGRRTLTELATGADERAAQIAANLERWRRLPRRLGDPHVAVNVAGATLSLVENGAETWTTRVIVGDVRHPTPVLSAQIEAVTLNPFWNIPHSIATREMLPRLRRDPGYLEANDIVILDRPDDPYGRRIDWRSIAAAAFPFRLQQQPGRKNSLGGLKFEMPNRFSVYLHDTPSKALFARAERGFSHGCVRVERPAELAARLLRQAEWDATRLDDAIGEGETRRLRLPGPVPVHILYWTAFVDAEGQVNFRPDLYRRDRRLMQALGLPRRSPHVTTALDDHVGCPEPS